MAAIEERYLGKTNLEDFGDDRRHGGWAYINWLQYGAGPAASPLRKTAPFDTRSQREPPSGQTLIENHVNAMDVYHHPENRAIMGSPLGVAPDRRCSSPMFSFTSLHLHKTLFFAGQ
ncbi:BQ2448_5067 [Microbotryum intermedium]|uniref:BQ2448_5067 protein n=1 Tax=Microbotryum intermedium TaxID=269621 RepID=A0A238F8R2_9BASI|nr:BQ2448_5067 [Microbotryum intermedium]